MARAAMRSKWFGLAKKGLHLGIVLLLVSTLTFLMVDLLPGDAAYHLAGMDASPASVAALRSELGLDRPLVVRYGEWLARVCRGDLGLSVRTREPVLASIAARLPVTVALMVLAQVMALLLAVPVGVVSAHRRESPLDKVFSATAFATMSMPVYVMALVLILVFSLRLAWFPATGYTPFAENPLMTIRSLLLPAASIALVEWVPLMRVLRSDMIAVLQEDYILMARAKGLPPHRILFRHALKPASLTLITLLGLQVGHLMGGAVIVETLFALPGVGRLLVGAVYEQDHNLVQGCLLLIAAAYVAVNFVVDALYAVLDPRLRAGAVSR